MKDKTILAVAIIICSAAVCPPLLPVVILFLMIFGLIEL